MVREALVYEKFYLLIKHIYEKKTLAESQKKDGIAIIVFCLFFFKLLDPKRLRD